MAFLLRSLASDTHVNSNEYAFAGSMPHATHITHTSCLFTLGQITFQFSFSLADCNFFQMILKMK